MSAWRSARGGRVDRGRALLEEAVALSAADRRPRPWALAILGMITYLQGDIERTVTVVEGGENFSAFVSRFHTICCERRSSR